MPIVVAVAFPIEYPRYAKRVRGVVQANQLHELVSLREVPIRRDAVEAPDKISHSLAVTRLLAFERFYDLVLCTGQWRDDYWRAAFVRIVHDLPIASNEKVGIVHSRIDDERPWTELDPRPRMWRDEKLAERLTIFAKHTLSR